MAKNRKKHVSQTPATTFLHENKVDFVGHAYAYEAHGGARQGAQALHWDAHQVIKTIIMEDQDGAPLVVLMHGDRRISAKQLAREIGVRSVTPCTPLAAERHTGYKVGGTSPFGTRKRMPVYMEESILAFDRIAINGGQRGFLIEIDPQVCLQLLAARPVHCAIDLQAA